MRTYKNKRTGAIIYSINELKGEYIEEVKKKPVRKEAKNGKDNK